MNKTGDVCHVRLNDDESEAFANYAKKVGVTRSKLIRRFIRYSINKEPDLQDDDKDIFRDAVYELSRFLISLNQITAAINEGKVNSTDSSTAIIEDAIKQVEQLRQEMNSYIRRVSRRWVNVLQTDD